MMGLLIFSASSLNKTVDEILFSDYKEFHIAGHDLAIAQTTCVDSIAMLARKEEFLERMRHTAKKTGQHMLLWMITDVLMEGSHIVYVGDDEVIRQAFHVVPKDNVIFLSGVMSRKKQVLPMLSAIWA